MAHETGADGSPKAAGTGKKAEETETVPAAGGDWEMPCIRSARAFPESPPDF